MLRILTDLELSKISGGSGDVCSSENSCAMCNTPFAKGDTVVYMYPVYEIHNIKTGNFIRTCTGDISIICNTNGCMNDYKTLKRNVLQVGNIKLKPLAIRYRFCTYNK